jgi:hypothetical protein|nr:MAG TPA: hypothetical protein [Caudoviricetes sp.]
MIVQAEDMAKAVRVAVDMNHSSTPLLVDDDIDTESFDEIIYAKLVDAVRVVEQEAPLHLLEQGHQFGGDNVNWTENGKGWIILPDDFMRLVVFKMSDWKLSVSDAISQDDPLYLRQFSRWKGISGNPEKPVVAIVNRAEGTVLEFFSCNDNTATIEQAVYVPYPKIDIDGGIDVSEKCYRAAIYRAASFALASIGDQLSTTMLELSKSLLI